MELNLEFPQILVKLILLNGGVPTKAEECAHIDVEALGKLFVFSHVCIIFSSTHKV